MRISLRTKLIYITISLLFFVTMAASIISTIEIQRYYKTKILEQMSTQLEELEFLLSNTDIAASHDSQFSNLAGYAHKSGIRITFIDSDGLVIFDSNVPQDSLKYLENHLHRPEIQMSLEKNIGFDKRVSATVHESMFYTAKQFMHTLPESSFLHRIYFIRLAVPLEEIDDVLSALRWKITGGGAIALIIIAIVSYYISSRLTYPIHRLAKVAESVKRGDLEARFEHHRDDEIGELAGLLNEMLEKLRNDVVYLRKLEKMRSQFLGNVSHELRTPIFAIQGYLETLIQTKKFDPKTQRKFIKKAYRQAVRLNNLLTDLIEISRIESGEMKMSFTSFDVKSWLEKVVKELQETANDNNITLTLFKDTGEAVYVLGDYSRLKQVVTNLVENAIKYNVPHGKVNIGYTVNDDEVKIFVSDTGRGISQEHVSRIFERFYRVDKERSRDVGGTGLGLAIVKHIVEAHDSSINVISEIDKGSTFIFSLRKAPPGPVQDSV